MSIESRFYIRFRGRKIGPLTVDKVAELVKRGQVTRMHEISADGISWQPASNFQEFFPPQRIQKEQVEETASNRVESTQNLSDSPKAKPSSVRERADTPSEPSTDSEEWYVHYDNRNHGPLPLSRIKEWLRDNRIDGETLVWTSRLSDWQVLRDAIPELIPATSPKAAPTIRRTQYEQNVFSNSKSPTDLELPQALVDEFTRVKGWASFFGVVMITVHALAFVGILINTLTEIGDANDPETRFRLILGNGIDVAESAFLFTIGIFAIRYSASLTRLSFHGDNSSLLLSAKRLSSIVTFCGIATIVWVVLLAVIFAIVFAMGLAVRDVYF